MLPIYLHPNATLCPGNKAEQTHQPPETYSNEVSCPEHVFSNGFGVIQAIQSGQRKILHTSHNLIKSTTIVRCSSPIGGAAPNSKWYEDARCLDGNFSPGPHDVICGRGRAVWNHPGNMSVRDAVKRSTGAYANARNRAERSVIVSEIVDSIRKKGTGFVKKQGVRWVEVGDLLAREKVGQMLRNALSSRYKSSVASKQRRRKDVHTTRLKTLHDVMQSNKLIQQSVSTMKAATSQNDASEGALMDLFEREQRKMLQTIKNDDHGLLDRFLEAEVASCLENDDTSTRTDSDGDVEMQCH